MPELPDVENFRRRAAASSLHHKIERVQISKERILEGTSPQGAGRKLKGKTFERTERHGKYLLLLMNDDCLVLHFGMTGDLQFVKDDDSLPKYTCAEFHFADGGSLAYVSRRLLGRIFFVKDLEDLQQMKQLGPDALKVSAKEFQQRIGDKQGSVKSALMDQSLIAGLGNVYSDEILFQQRIHPGAKMNQLDQKEIGRLYRTCQRVLETTIKHHAEPKEMPSGYLLPHRAGDFKCPRCKGDLDKFEVGGRRAIYCPNCQSKS